MASDRSSAGGASCLAAEPSVGMWSAAYRIGEVLLGLKGNINCDQISNPDLELFRSEDSNYDIEITLLWAGELPPPSGRLLFDSGSIWKLYNDPAGEDGDMIFDFASPVVGRDPYKRLYVDRDFRKGLLLMNRSCFPEGSYCNPLEYPLDELVVIHRLGRERGVEVHAAGLYDRSLPNVGGFLFIGHSGAGKSTTTRLWRERRDVTILSDDRIILRKHDGQVWMHGTPWHGEAAFAAAEKSKIDKLFILEHAPETRITQLRGSQAVGELMARSFLPFYDGPSLESTMAFLQEIVETIPCYKLQFLPDSSAVEAVLNFRP